MSAVRSVGGVAEERIGGSTAGRTLATWVCGRCRDTSSVVLVSSDSGGIVWLNRITMY